MPLGAKCIVEHTNINPNKAAHIGHLRNAALGDTFVRLLRRAGRRVEVQNYIDNTGVQVADVVVGFQHIEKKSVEEVRALAAGAALRLFMLGPVRAGDAIFLRKTSRGSRCAAGRCAPSRRATAPRRRLADIVSVAISRCHLRTMARLGDRVRPVAAGERNSAAEILGCGV